MLLVLGNRLARFPVSPRADFAPRIGQFLWGLPEVVERDCGIVCIDEGIRDSLKRVGGILMEY